MPRPVTLISIGVLTLILGYEFYQVLAPFLLPLFLAAVSALLVEPLNRRFQKRFPGRPSLSAGLTTVTVVILVLIPFVLSTVLAAGQLARLASNISQDPAWGDRLAKIQAQPWVREAINAGRTAVGMDAPAGDAHDAEMRNEIKERAREAGTWLAQRTLGVAGSTVAIASGFAGFAVSAMTFLFAFYYFLADGPAMYVSARNMLPVEGAQIDKLADQFEAAVRGVVMATLAAAVGQGIATAAAIWVCGLGNFFLFSLVGTFSALVPLLGTWLVWVPAAGWLWFTGHTTAAIVLTLFCMFVVAMLDNVIRTYVLNNSVELHPVLAFVSVLGGLQALGLWGVFIGPVVASCLFAAVKIFNQELSAYVTTHGHPVSVSASASPATNTVPGSSTTAVILPSTEPPAPLAP